ncbi:MAG: Siroheme synthase [Phycisphaerae bacterium]|nr:Siroheme synthase [Phycisphaerae bacterium]
MALVGAGPGDPGLITVAGARLLEQADVVVYDRLANPALLKLAPPCAELINVGKQAGSHAMPQERINQVLVEQGRTGKRVVRLKGGDPFIFGRGGEEAEALVDAGLRFIVVPGVTSGVAAPAYAGIPVTHRDFTSSFTVVTGHEDPTKPDSSLDYAVLAKLDSVAFYMSIGNLARNSTALIAAGKAPSTPVAVIERGTWPGQRTIVGTLADIAAKVGAAAIRPPAMVLVGPTAGLHDKLNWFENRPLFGRRIVVTRTRQQASALSEGLADLGAEVIEAPTIRIEGPEDTAAVDAEFRRLGEYDFVVFTSANGVRLWAEWMRAIGLDGRALGQARLAAVGPATAAAMEELFLRPDVIPEQFVAESLVESFKALGDLTGKRFLLLRADIARAAVNEALTRLGAEVADVAIYRTLPADSLPAELADGRIDWVTFTSSSTVANFLALAPAGLAADLKSGATRAACIGPITAETFSQLAGREPDVVADEHTIAGLLQAISTHGGNRK